jgi:hypothetical protein
VPRDARGSKSHAGKWAAAGLAAVVGVASLGYAASLHRAMSTQQALMAQMQQQMDAMHAAIIQNVKSDASVVQQETISVSARHADALPSKFAVPGVTPLKTQDERGTCWDFATVGVLENSYRKQGVERGWLAPDEYMGISEQAYGAEILRMCSSSQSTRHEVTCSNGGIPSNSTDGGETAYLFYLQNGFERSIFPNSICPYLPDPGNDAECDGLTSEKRAANPLKLKIKKLHTYLDIHSVKQALVTDRQAMGISTAMPYITYYYPCIGEFASDERCNPASPSCTICPPELAATTCCIPVEGKENYNMKGEYITSHIMTNEGGHAMTLAGYNDNYRTQQGYTGGFILKNSWFDGIRPPLGSVHARGSHSLKYWLQEVTDWEEVVMCPNSHNPENWYQCGNSGEVIHAHADGGDGGADVPFPVGRSVTPTGGVEECLTEETALYAKTSFAPLHLRCLDAEWCDTSADVTYFTRNSTAWGDRMLRMCFFEFNSVTKASSEVCLPPLLGQTIAYILSPVDEEILEDDPDVCGYYFYPYEVMRTYARTFGDVSIDNFELEWHPQSYAANQALYPELDYSDVVASTRKQRQYDFVGPFPFARVVSKEELPNVSEP